MDTITHALSGALLAIAIAPSAARPGALSPRARLVAGAAAAAFPDSDMLLRAIDTLTYLNLHQGVTHSLILLPAWALALAWLFAALSRRRYRWQAFYGIAALGLAIHIGGDLLTAYGTQLLAPFSAARVSWPLVFLIDPYLTVIVVAGLAAARLWPERRPAHIAFLVLAGYLGLLAVLQQRAVDIGADYARAQRLDGAVSHALPQPLSPFHWLIVVQHGDAYYEARVNLAGAGKPMRAAADDSFLRHLAAGYAPVTAAVWMRRSPFGEPPYAPLARSAFDDAALAGFRRFAQFAVLDHVETWPASGVCVWFTDLRFGLPGVPSSFRYGLCRSDGGADWRLARLRGAFYID